MAGKKRASGKGDGSYSRSVPKAGAKMAGDNNPKSIRAMSPKGRSDASNRGGGRLLRPAKNMRKK